MFTPPGSFGPFRVLHQIGTGVLGPVFRTYEPARDRLVAVKAFRLDLTPEQARALADELQQNAEAALDHPSIVRPLAAGLEGSLPYAASEYVAAESLDVALRHYAPATLERILPFITQLAGAIDFARTAGIGHGALHPRDVFVTPDEARATGFGVVQALEALGVRAPVRRPYTAPERVDEGEWDVRADIYSLGAIAFELITGRRPVGAAVGDLGATAAPHADAVAAVLARALDEDPEGRYSSALAFAAALEAASRGEQTTGAIEEVRAVAEVPAAPALRYEPDVEEEIDADTAEIQLREEEGSRERVEDAEEVSRDRSEELPPAPSSRAETPSAADASTRADESARAPLFDLDLTRDTEDGIPEVQHPGFSPGSERRFDVSEFADADSVADRGDAARTDAAGYGETAPGGITAFDSEDAEPPAQQPVRAAERVAPITPVTPIEPESVEPIERVEPIQPRRRASRPRSVLVPVAVTLLLGLFVGFVAGYLVGARDRSNGIVESAAVEEAPATPQTRATAPARPAASVPSAPPPQPTAAPTRATATPAAPARGRLVVRSTPPGAQVFVNGRRRGTTPLSVRDLPEGTYTVRVTRNGFQETTQRVSVGASAVRDVTLRLTRERPRPSPAARPATFTGTLFVDSRPRGARVLLDGREIGTTPMQLGDVRAGAHVVRLELPKHRPWSVSTRVVAGETVRVTGSLEPRP